MANFYTFKISNSFNELEMLCARIDELAKTSGFPKHLLFCLNICLEEVISNIIKYAYSDKNQHQIDVQIEIANEIITLTIIDDGHEFDPLKVKIPDIDADLKSRKIGGIGVFLTCKMANKVMYKREKNKNIIKIIISRTVCFYK